MSVLSVLQNTQVLSNIFEQKKFLMSPLPHGPKPITLLAEKLHLLLNPDVMLPQTDEYLVKAWYSFKDWNMPFYIVSGSNLGGLPDGTVVEPNGHLMELKTVNNIQFLQAICEHDYLQ